MSERNVYKITLRVKQKFTISALTQAEAVKEAKKRFGQLQFEHTDLIDSEVMLISNNK